MVEARDHSVTLALCGNLMTGRGIDQLLPDPCPPTLYETYVKNAKDYVALAEEKSGPIARPASLAYPSGDALAELDAMKPDARIVNLETALTRSEDAWPGKGIHYRTSPENARMLAAAGIDCCTLANNHVLDWGHTGLAETLRTLRTLNARHAGAGPVDLTRKVSSTFRESSRLQHCVCLSPRSNPIVMPRSAVIFLLMPVSSLGHA
jgi:poly-gamma-glutamate synthesis protein (capsule biosynthesis protein)